MVVGMMLTRATSRNVWVIAHPLDRFCYIHLSETVRFGIGPLAVVWCDGAIIIRLGESLKTRTIALGSENLDKVTLAAGVLPKRCMEGKSEGVQWSGTRVRSSTAVERIA